MQGAYLYIFLHSNTENFYDKDEDLRNTEIKLTVSESTLLQVLNQIFRFFVFCF
jgi:hypothetical protein